MHTPPVAPAAADEAEHGLPEKEGHTVSKGRVSHNGFPLPAFSNMFSRATVEENFPKVSQSVLCLPCKIRQLLT